jgi:large subunit ribosomal protein L21
MYAVIKTGGKQYKVTKGDVLEVEHLKLKSASTTLTPVLVVNDEGKTIFGSKELASYKVGIKVLGDAKGDKVTVFKYRPKTGYASKTGHRQLYSLIEITSIGSDGRTKSKDAAAAKTEAKAEAAPKAKTKKADPKPAPAADDQPAAEPPAPAAEKSSQPDNLAGDGT